MDDDRARRSGGAGNGGEVVEGELAPHGAGYEEVFVIEERRGGNEGVAHRANRRGERGGVGRVYIVDNMLTNGPKRSWGTYMDFAILIGPQRRLAGRWSWW